MYSYCIVLNLFFYKARDVRGDVHLLNETVLNTSVYFHTDGRPVVVVYIQVYLTKLILIIIICFNGFATCSKQLPETLYYYHLSYSLTVENRQDDVITQLDSQHYVRSGVIKEAIEGNLKKDQTYNLKVEMSICLHSNTLMLTFSEFTYNATYMSVLPSLAQISMFKVQSSNTICKSSFADLRLALINVQIS